MVLFRVKEQSKDSDPILESDSNRKTLIRDCPQRADCKIVAYIARLYSSRSQSCSSTFILTLPFILPHSWQLRVVIQVYHDLSIELQNLRKKADVTVLSIGSIRVTVPSYSLLNSMLQQKSTLSDNDKAIHCDS